VSPFPVVAMAEHPDPLSRLPSLERVVAITAYDYPTARLVDEAGVDLVLVGDSLGMVFAGWENTTHVTVDHMIYHTEIVARAVSRAILAADLPYQSYRTADEAVRNAERLLEVGAEAVKLEGGLAIRPQIRSLAQRSIPLVGHLGMLPQSVVAEQGYTRKGRTKGEARRLHDDARFLEDEGARAIVLESIVPEVAESITHALSIPTIGIGSGDRCRGEIAVLHDVIGAYPWFCPPFAVPRAEVAREVSRAVKTYAAEVRRVSSPR